jgi:hypothetical protein
MTESTDLIAKKAALQALEASISLHIRRAEELNVEYQKLSAEIEGSPHET